MATTPDDQAGLKKYIDELKAQGKTESTSKSLAKAVIKLKQFTPDKFDLEAGGGNEAILQRGVEDPTPEIPDAPAFGLTGFSGDATSASTERISGVPTSLDLNKMYEEGMQSEEITSLESELTTKKEALTTALTGINDNPFYSEVTRTGKIAKLNEQAQREINDIQDQVNLKKADVQVKMNIAQQQYAIESDQYQRNLQQLNFLVSTGAIARASGKDIAQIALATGMSTDMVRAIQERAIKSEVEPYVINSNDDYGNVTVSIIDLNTTELIASRSLGAIGSGTSKASSAGGSWYDYIEGDTFQEVGGEGGYAQQFATPQGPMMNSTIDTYLSQMGGF